MASRLMRQVILQGALLGCAALQPPLAVAQPSSATNGVSPDRVLFGQSAKLSGTGGTQAGKQYREGLLLAFNAANKGGGVFGRRVELLSLDDEINVNKAVANTKELIEKHRVFALIGHTFTNTVKSVLPMVREAKIPMIAPYTGFPELYDGSQRDVFTIRASFADELATLVRHIDTVSYDHIALVHYTNPLGEEFKKEVSTELQRIGRSLVASAGIPLNPPDPAQAVQPATGILAQACPKVVVLGVSGKDAAALVRAMKAQGCPPARYLARGLVDITLLMRELGEEARGIMVTQLVPNPFRSSAHPLVQEYRQLLQQRDAAAPPDFAEFEGFIAGRFAIQALRRTGPELDRPKFVHALEAERLDGPGHYRLQFGPSKRVGSQYVNIVMISDHGRIAD
jgi:branched-chain amino acid transport system substrate-binding protein